MPCPHVTMLQLLHVFISFVFSTLQTGDLISGGVEVQTDQVNIISLSLSLSLSPTLSLWLFLSGSLPLSL